MCWTQRRHLTQCAPIQPTGVEMRRNFNRLKRFMMEFFLAVCLVRSWAKALLRRG